MSIRNSIAFVTGGNSGLGKACVDRFLQNGIKGVLAFDLSSPSASKNEQLLSVQGDVASEADVKHALDLCSKQFGEFPRIVVNCAGIAPSVRVLSSKPPHTPHALDLFEKVLRVNVIGTFNVLRLTSEKMVAQDLKDNDGQRGVIINTASIAAFDGQIGQIAYSASKGAIASMCLPAARDLANQGIRVVTMAPGVFNTPMVAALPEPAKASLAKQIPFPSRLGNPDEFADFVLFGIIDNVMLNGEIIRFDGALRMGPR